MAGSQIFQMVQSLMADLFDLDETQIDFNSRFDSLGLGAAEKDELMDALGDFLESPIPEEEANRIKTVDALVDYIGEHS